MTMSRTRHGPIEQSLLSTESIHPITAQTEEDRDWNHQIEEGFDGPAGLMETTNLDGFSTATTYTTMQIMASTIARVSTSTSIILFHEDMTLPPLVLRRGVQPRGSAGEHVFATRAPSTVYMNLRDTHGIDNAVG